MIVKDNIPIMKLVKKIFRETYDVEDDELYRNFKLRGRIRDAVKILRLSYQSNVCVTDYSEEEIRKAYMIAYYPYYIEPARYVAEFYLKQNLPPSKGNWAFFAGGPCPELFGVAQALSSPPHVITLDLEQNWFPYQKITCALCRENESFRSRLRSCYGFDIGGSLPRADRSHDDLRKANIFFLQNYLSHLSPTNENINKFLSWFSRWVVEAKRAACFAFVDLNYGSTAKIFYRLGNENFLRVHGLKKIAAHTPADGEPLTIHHGGTTPALLKNIFTGEKYLWHRWLTNFYFIVLQKR